MFNKTKLAKLELENQALRDEVKRLRAASLAMNKKDAVDLTREILKLMPLDKNFNPLDESFSANDYIKHVSDLDYNTTLKAEMKKIIHEQVEYIATQSPNRECDLLARGTINGISLLQERISTARGFIEYKEKQGKNQELE